MKLTLADSLLVFLLLLKGAFPYHLCMKGLSHCTLHLAPRSVLYGDCLLMWVFSALTVGPEGGSDACHIRVAQRLTLHRRSTNSCWVNEQKGWCLTAGINADVSSASGGKSPTTGPPPKVEVVG